MPPAEPSAEATELRQRRIAALRAAATNKQQAAVGRAEKALRQLIKRGDTINFRSVADAANVSVNFLYTSPGLRATIEQLRAQQNEASRPSPEPGPNRDRSVIRTLTAKLAAERHQHRDELNELKAALGAAHGEMLNLRRQLAHRHAG
jgi:Family of unknown function (DUF6262)